MWTLVVALPPAGRRALRAPMSQQQKVRFSDLPADEAQKVIANGVSLGVLRASIILGGLCFVVWFAAFLLLSKT